MHNLVPKKQKTLETLFVFFFNALPSPLSLNYRSHNVMEFSILDPQLLPPSLSLHPLALKENIKFSMIM